MNQIQSEGGMFVDEDGEEDDEENEKDDAKTSDDGDDEGDSEEDDDEEEPSWLRDAAAALTVGVGSFSDPPDCQGLAHFLGACG